MASQCSQEWLIDSVNLPSSLLDIGYHWLEKFLESAYYVHQILHLALAMFSLVAGLSTAFLPCNFSDVFVTYLWEKCVYSGDSFPFLIGLLFKTPSNLVETYFDWIHLRFLFGLGWRLYSSWASSPRVYQILVGPKLLLSNTWLSHFSPSLVQLVEFSCLRAGVCSGSHTSFTYTWSDVGLKRQFSSFRCTYSIRILLLTADPQFQPKL